MFYFLLQHHSAPPNLKTHASSGVVCLSCCEGSPRAFCSGDLWAEEILALLKLFQNILTVSAMRVVCETETRWVIKISSYAF